jgi:Mg2+ and Co2+ transporter CorA|tara:strand:+ start:3332 stop:3742 length:411 start_codon:yes stop_codon:yes gene_type:complete
MEKIETFRNKTKLLESLVKYDKESYDEWDFYSIKKEMLEFKYLNPDNTEIDKLISLMESLETTHDKRESKKMNHKLNLLTIWSTIFLPLSFYTGMWGMNFDDVPLLTGDDGFWIFVTISILTTLVMFGYFKKHKWY